MLNEQDLLGLGDFDKKYPKKQEMPDFGSLIPELENLLGKDKQPTLGERVRGGLRKLGEKVRGAGKPAPRLRPVNNPV
jgi:hypothetical protein